MELFVSTCLCACGFAGLYGVLYVWDCLLGLFEIKCVPACFFYIYFLGFLECMKVVILLVSVLHAANIWVVVEWVYFERYLIIK